MMMVDWAKFMLRFFVLFPPLQKQNKMFLILIENNNNIRLTFQIINYNSIASPTTTLTLLSIGVT